MTTKRLSDDLLSLTSLDQEPILEEDEFQANHRSSHGGTYDIPVLLPEEFGTRQEEEDSGNSGFATVEARAIKAGTSEDYASSPSTATGLQTISSHPSVSTIDTIGTRVFGTPLTNSPIQTYVRESSISVASLGTDENGGIVQSPSTKTVTGVIVGVGLGVLNCEAYAGSPRSMLDGDADSERKSAGTVRHSGREEETTSGAQAFSPNGTRLDTEDEAADTSSDSNRVISLVTEWAPASHWQSEASLASPITPTTPKFIDSGRTTPRALRSPAIRQRGAKHVRNFSRPTSQFSPVQKIVTSMTTSELALQFDTSPVKTKKRPLSELVSRSPLLCKAGRSPKFVAPKAAEPTIVLPCLKEARWLRDCNVQLWIDQEGFRSICPDFKLSRVAYAPLDELVDLPESCRIAAYGFGQIDTEMTLLSTVAEFIPSTRETYYFHHAAMDRAPCLRRITVGKDEGKDYVHRQASLNVKTHGVYAVTGSEEYRIAGDGGHPDRVVSMHWKFEYFVNERWNDRTGKLMQGERTFRPLSFTCTSMLLRSSRATKVKLFNVVKKKIISSKLAAEKVEPPMPPPNWRHDRILESPLEECMHRGNDVHEKEVTEASPIRAKWTAKHARTFSQQESGCRLFDIKAEAASKGHGRARSASYSREKTFGAMQAGLGLENTHELPSKRVSATVGARGPIGPIMPREELLRMLAEDTDPKPIEAQSPVVQVNQPWREERVDDGNDDVPLLALSPPPATVYTRTKPIPTCI